MYTVKSKTSVTGSPRAVIRPDVNAQGWVWL